MAPPTTSAMLVPAMTMTVLALSLDVTAWTTLDATADSAPMPRPAVCPTTPATVPATVPAASTGTRTTAATASHRSTAWTLYASTSTSR